jgi:toxin CcdB
MIRQFDVVPNPDAEDSPYRPYLVVLQSDLVSGLRSTVVAPLVARAHYEGARRLNPIIIFEGHEYWLATHELFAVEQRVLQNKIGTLSDERYTITAAIDFLFTGV